MRRLSIEELEQRIAPDGNVEVDVHNGDLILVGDSMANFVFIDQVGCTEHQFRVTSGAIATNINGQGDPVIFDGVTGDIRITLESEGDDYSLKGVAVDGDVIAKGAADGGFAFGTDENSVVHGDVIFKSAGGWNGIEVMGVVDGNVKLTNGPGDSVVAVGGTFHGSVSIKTGAAEGANEIWVYSDSTIDGNLIITSGRGDDALDIEESDIAGNLSINTGAGYTESTISYIDVGGDFKYRGGNESAMEIQGLNVAGNSAITNGNGTEDGMQTYIQISESTFGIGGAKPGDLSIKNGNTDDYLDMMLVIVGRNLTINDGNGYGSYTQLSTIDIGGAFTFRSGTSSDGLYLPYVTVHGKTNIQTGSNGDGIMINDSLFTGQFSVNAGAGSDGIYIDANEGDDLPDPTVFQSAVVVNGGSGDDVFALGQAGFAECYGEYFGPVKVIGGSGIDLIAIKNAGNIFHSTYAESGVEIAT